MGKALLQRLQRSAEWSIVAVHGSRASPGLNSIDITDATAVRDLIRAAQPRAIVHLAGMTGIACSDDRSQALEVNVRAVETVARASTTYGVSTLLFPSTSAVYGDRYASPVAEGAALDIRNVYAETKARAEEILRNLHTAGAGPAAAILRIFNVFGPGLSDSLVERLLVSGPSNPVSLTGSDTFTRDYSSVSDIAAVLEFALSIPDAYPDQTMTLNVGSGVPLTNTQLVQHLRKDQEIYTRVVGGKWSYSCADVSAAALLRMPLPKGLTGARAQTAP